MKRKQIIDLLKTGKFSVVYHDNTACAIYKGHYTYEDLPEKHLIELQGNGYGYVPDIVDLLVEALGGKTDSV